MTQSNLKVRKIRLDAITGKMQALLRSQSVQTLEPPQDVAEEQERPVSTVAQLPPRGRMLTLPQRQKQETPPSPPVPPPSPQQKEPQTALEAQQKKKAWSFRLWRKHVPEILQMSQVECGLTSLAMILCYYGRKTSVSELRTTYGVGRDGASARSIVKAARDFGLRVRAISLQKNDFSHVHLPAIIHWQFSHWLVVEHWTPKYVDIVDPAGGRRRVSAEEFDSSFTGIVILLEPGPNFSRVTPKPAVSLRSYIVGAIGQAPASMLQVMITSVLLQTLGLALPLLTKVVADQILPARMDSAMFLLGVGMLMILLSQSVVSLLREWILVYLRSRIDINLMLGFFEHLLVLPYSFFQQRSSGDLLSRVNSNIMIRDTLSSQMIAALLDSSMVLLYLLILMAQSPAYGLLALAVGLMQVVLTLGTARPITQLANQELAAQGKAQGYMSEALAGIATLKAAGAEYSAYERWANLFFDQLNLSIKRSYLVAGLGVALTALRLFSPMALLWVGAQQVLNGSLSIGSMLALNALAVAFLDPLSALVNRGQQLQMVQAHLARLSDIMTSAPEQEGKDVRQPPQLTGDIRLENIGFSYSSDSPKVLHNISISIKAGQKVAIVGRTGSGKSTFGKLLLGLYLPTEGEIYYDDHPLRELEIQEVRRQFGVVLQDAAIFSGTVMQNIALNNPSMPKEKILEAARVAAIDEDIERMPMGYDTYVAEGGSALSGGQRQRLAMARAVANKPAILLLDEATSSLDVKTERKVATNLQLFPCTQIIIAHRLSTIRHADVILVMDKGTIVEAGSHDELLQRNGHYANLVQQQMERDKSEKLKAYYEK
jgi:HlyB family type I secretion system ABC transporter